jgi:hypothetical protein
MQVIIITEVSGLVYIYWVTHLKVEHRLNVMKIREIGFETVSDCLSGSETSQMILEVSKWFWEYMEGF